MLNISVITVTYNAAATIADCLKSVANQSYPVAEHIIIDGASTDNTLEVISSLALHSLQPRHVYSEPDNGIYDAMNKGIALATGDIVGILNADDSYASAYVLAKVAKIFKDPAVMSCYGDLEYVREASGRLQGVIHNSKSNNQNLQVVRSWKSGEFSPENFYWGWMPPHPTFFVRRSVYEKFGGFRLDLGTAADYELMLRLLLKERITCAYISAVVVRMRAGGVSNSSIVARLKANRMDCNAWKVNNLQPNPWTLLCKPLLKISQWFA